MSGRSSGCTGWLLRLYPRAYRQRFAADMMRTLRQEHARGHDAGAAALLRFWIVTAWEAVRFGMRERLRPAAGGGATIWLRAADVRYAVRLLRGSPVFSATAILSLAIGISAATVISALADGLLRQPSPGVRSPSRVVEIERTTNGRGFGTLSYPAYLHLREHTRTLDAVAAVVPEPAPVSLTVEGSSERVYAAAVSSTYFEALGVRTVAGRFFTQAEDDHRDPRRVAVIGHQLWRERFGSDPAVLQRSVKINNLDFDVVGVAEPGFTGHTIAAAEVWLPITATPAYPPEVLRRRLADPAHTWHRAIGRLSVGTSRAAAEAELRALFDRYTASTPSAARSHGLLLASSGRLPPPARAPFAAFFTLLFALTAALVVIACSNVAGVLLARAASRRREIATRLAIGASRRHILCQMLVESLVLFGAAAVLSVPMVLWIAAAFRALLPGLPIAIHFELPVDARTVLFATGLALITGLLFGLTPARYALRADLAGLLHGQSSTAGRERLRARRALVVMQVALSLATAISTALFFRTLQSAASTDAGFDTRNVVVVTLDTALAGADATRAQPIIAAIVERFAAIPGVQTVGHGRTIPLQGGGFSIGRVRLPGEREEEGLRLADANWDVISPDYFRAVGLPLAAGRAFDTEDRPGRPFVAIVNETFARTAWPGQTAVGREVLQPLPDGQGTRTIEVVGVARDARYRTAGEPPRPLLFVPFAQHPQTRVELFVKHSGDHRLAATARDVVGAVEPALPVILVQSFDDAAAVGLLPQRVAAAVGAVLGAIGMLLATLGVYGLAAFVVTERRREIAIRMALGASTADVRSLVLGETWRLGLVALPLGCLLGWVVERVARRLNLLVDAGAGEIVALAVPVAIVGLSLLAANYLPARRAAATDPARALRP